MLFLNLLPEKFKKEMKFRNLFRVVLRAGNILIFAVIIIAGSFYISSKIVNNFYRVVNNTNFLMQIKVKNPVEVREVNRKINSIEDMQGRSFNWMNSLEAVSRILPRNIYIESLEISKKNSQISMTGVALTRQSLVYLKENLENSDKFTEMNFPIKNILKKRNIHFDISVKFQKI